MSFALVKRNVAYVTVKKVHFKALNGISQTSVIANHTVKTGHNIKWDHFQVLASGSSDLHCKIKENIGSEKL